MQSANDLQLLNKSLWRVQFSAETIRGRLQPMVIIVMFISLVYLQPPFNRHATKFYGMDVRNDIDVNDIDTESKFGA